MAGLSVVADSLSAVKYAKVQGMELGVQLGHGTLQHCLLFYPIVLAMFRALQAFTASCFIPLSYSVGLRGPPGLVL